MPIAESKAGLEAATAGLGLLGELIKLARDAKKDKNHPLAINEVMLQLPVAAHRVAGDFVRELQKLRQDMIEAQLDTSKSLEQLQSDTSFWRLKKWKVLRNFKPRVNSLVSSIENFFDDVVAVANCREADAVLATSYQQSLAQKREIRGLIADGRPLGQVVEDLIAVAQQQQADLADLLK